MKPMNVVREQPELRSLQWPYYLSPKLDGFRAVVRRGRLLGKRLEPIPNKFVAARFSSSFLDGVDGELILGDPTDPQCFNKTSAALRAEEGEPDVKLWLFDRWDSKLPYAKRYDDLRTVYGGSYMDYHVIVLPSILCRGAEEAEVLVAEWVAKGYEGGVLKHPDGYYKFGRTTAREATAFKLKPFVDSEFQLTEVEEEMENRGRATRDKVGNVRRSKRAENLVGKGRAGTLVGFDIETKQPVRIPCSALTHAEREQVWRDRERLVAEGAIGTYKHMPGGAKDRRRSPVFKAWRPRWDMSL